MKLFQACSDEPNLEYAMVDATIVKVHRQGQGAKGGTESQAIGRFKGGMTTKILAFTDGLGSLVRFELLPGHRFATLGVEPLIEGIDFGGLIADKASDSDTIFADLNARGIVSITEHHNRISLEATQPIPFGLNLEEIEHRIVQAYLRLAFQADKASGSRAVFITGSSLLEVQMTEMPPEVLMLGQPLFMLEVFSLPSHSTVDSFGFFDLDDTELASATTFVVGAAGEAENKTDAVLHKAAAIEPCGY